jgi:hypothetical protein
MRFKKDAARCIGQAKEVGMGAWRIVLSKRRLTFAPIEV